VRDRVGIAVSSNQNKFQSNNGLLFLGNIHAEIADKGHGVASTKLLAICDLSISTLTNRPRDI
jgi:hypothetical protein